MILPDQALLGLIAGFYLRECCAQVRRDAEPLCEWRIGQWGRPLVLSVTEHRKWVLLNPMPWSLSAVPGEGCSPGGDAKESWHGDVVAKCPDDRCRTDSEREDLWSAGARPDTSVTEPASPPHQTGLSTAQTALLAPHQNPAVIRAADRSLRRLTRPLRISATLLGICWIVLTGSWLGQFLLPRDAITVLLAATPAFWMSTIVLYGIASSRLLPNRRGELLREMLMLGVSPFSAVRSAEQLSRKLFAAFDPVALPIALLDRDRALQFARQQWGSQLSRRRRPSGETPADASLRDVPEIHPASLLRFLAIHEISAAELTAPPQPDPDAAGYCPACLGQFVWADRECPNGCGFMVIGFAPSNQPTDPTDVVLEDLNGSHPRGCSTSPGCATSTETSVS